MAIIETKFGMGDVAWYATTTTEQKEHPCPDCLGSRKWEAKSPAGGTFEVDCPRCTNSYLSNRELSLKYSQHAPAVRKLTIGLIRTYDGIGGGHRYMAHETGIGSGSLYDEDRLFSTEEEARQFAQALAEGANADPNGWVAKQFEGRIELSDHQLKDAEIKAAKDVVWNAWWAYRCLSEEFENLVEDESRTRDELRDDLREALKWEKGRRERPPVDALVRAAVAFSTTPEGAPLAEAVAALPAFVRTPEPELTTAEPLEFA